MAFAGGFSVASQLLYDRVVIPRSVVTSKEVPVVRNPKAWGPVSGARLLFAVVVCTVGAGSPLIRAEVLFVPEGYSTIQSAIDAAAPGDVVLVSAGTYDESIDFLGKSIRVASREGAELTILEGQADRPVVSFVNAETRAAVLDGFTIRHEVSEQGSGIRCVGASPVILRNVIGPNFTAFGAGISCTNGADPAIIGNTIEENSATLVRPSWSGAGLYVADSSAYLADNVFRYNWVVRGPGNGIAIGCFGSRVTLENNEIRDSYAVDFIAAAVFVDDASEISMVGNRFYRNIEGFEAAPGAKVQLVENRFHRDRVRLFEVENVVVDSCWFESTLLSLEDCAGAAIRGSVFDSASLRVVRSDSLEVTSCRFIESGWTMDDCARPSIRQVTVLGAGFEGVEFKRCMGTVRISNSSFTESQIAVRTTDVVATNTILWNHSPLSVLTGSTHRFVASYCDIRGGWPGVGNFDADPLWIDPQFGDLRLRIESPCVDAGSNASGLVTETTDIDGDPRILPGPRRAHDRTPVPGAASAVARIDIGADEMRLEHAVRFGNVGDARAFFARVRPTLFANGSIGGARRELFVEPGAAFNLEAVAAPGGPSPGPFVLYAWPGEPTYDSVRRQPAGLGFAAFPTPLDGILDGPSPLAIWNNLGFRRQLGDPTLPSMPAPSVVLDVPSGLPAGTVLTVQGFQRDHESSSWTGVSVTNAIVVRVE